MKRIVCFLALLCLAPIGCAPTQTASQKAAPSVDEPAAVQESIAQQVDEELPSGQLVSAPLPETATLKAKFVLDGAAPKFANIDGSKDSFCATLDIPSELMVIGKGGEIQNLALILDARRSKAKIPAEMLKAEEKEIVLDNNGCIFKPHVLSVRPGQTVKVTNSDQCSHNANFNFFNNKPENFIVPVGGSKSLTVKTDEPAPIPVECNVHPWMKSYLIATEHPYVGIANEAGEITIENLPVGSVTFKVWHENAVRSIDEGTVNGKTERWSRGRMTLELSAGVNDLGTIKIPVDKFNK